MLSAGWRSNADWISAALFCTSFCWREGGHDGLNVSLCLSVPV